MAITISFPNFLCLLLTGGLAVHLLCQDSPLVTLPAVPDDMETLYCRLPQSYRPEDSRHCSSTQRLFLLLGNGCSLERSYKLKAEAEEQQNVTEAGEEYIVIDEGVNKIVNEELEEKEVQEKREEKSRKSSLVDWFVISLLVCSAIVSLMELYREKIRRKEQKGVGEAAAGSEAAGGRRISLVDLTVSRHIRRGDSQQLETIHQNTVASGSRPPLLRRSSFPAQVPESRVRLAPQRQQSTPSMAMPGGRRMSMDLGEGDGSPDRHRVRIIRRH